MAFCVHCNSEFVRKPLPQMSFHVRSLARATLRSSLFVLAAAAAAGAPAAAADGDPARGRAFFQLNCALCHATVLGPGGQPVSGQGPSLVGVLGRRAAALDNFGYSRALRESGIRWDAAALDRFLQAPSAAVPGTLMPVPVPNASDRLDIIAFLSHLDTMGIPMPAAVAAQGVPVGADPGDWRNDSPGKAHRIDLSKLPAPFATASSGNGPRVVERPGDAGLSVPPGFAVRVFATGLSGPRLLRTAPNGDTFIAETRAGRIRVIRAGDGAESPSSNEIFAEGLRGPFGIAFYPAGGEPEWVYVGNVDSVVRFPYRNGDLKARGEPQTIVPVLAPHNGGGHTTRDVTFSRDGRRMFISVGSGSNVAQDLPLKDAEELLVWEAVHGRGAAWGPETNRADILVTDPQGGAPLRTFATGIRNGVGLAVCPLTGDLWTSTNERDALGDDLVPDYITRVREGGFYGWPWYYMGSHEDPRHAGERPDLADTAIVPDVPLQAHSASLQIAFYTAAEGVSAFPAEFRGDVFAAEHGSWNRSSRTGYKVIRVRVKDGVPTGEYDDFMIGFVIDNRSVWGRPVGVAVAHDGALLVSDDGGDVIWRISYSAAR
jgi:glucose/arabinose dehydrogenase/cytochrome c2